MEEGSAGTKDGGVIYEPAVGVGMKYSPPLWDPPQWDADPFGLSDFDPGFSELEESVAEPDEKLNLGFGISDWEPDVSIDEPTIDPGIGEEMFGLNGFAEPPKEEVGLPGLNAEIESNPVLTDAESFFQVEEVEEDWLAF